MMTFTSALSLSVKLIKILLSPNCRLYGFGCGFASESGNSEVPSIENTVRIFSRTGASLVYAGVSPAVSQPDNHNDPRNMIIMIFTRTTLYNPDRQRCLRHFPIRPC